MINYDEAKYTYFPNRKEMLQFATNFLVRKYKKNLEYEMASAMDDKEEYVMWEERIKVEVPRLEKAINKLLWWVTLIFENVNIPPKGFILKIAFKMAKINMKPTECFPVNRSYKIEKNSFVEFMMSSKSN